jgi:EAL domain-containing protein (putative c-di-GMP-specific phosphodiesterase class I)/FixJ family two-component response regulator
MQIADLRFLVVEDHGFQRWALGNLLANMGAKHVLSAPDGQTALDIFKSDATIDIIVSDLDMPGMDGMEFIRHVGECGQGVSIIVSSGLDSALVASVATMARAYGVDLLGAIEKPPTAKKLEALIAQYGNTHQRERPAPASPVFTIDEIDKGLRRDEFEPFFQAKVDIATAKVVGAEALARWRHPTQGLVQPAAFIKPMEEHGRIDDLATSVLRKAAASCRAWSLAGRHSSVAVNLSLSTLADLTLVERLTDIVAEQRVEAQDVILEVTESAAASHLGKALENLSRLRMKGFGLAIDDYGTGYSSMQQLTRIPFTELKIDQSFVRDASTQPASRAMLESSLEMSRKLRIEAVAEGVESQVDWDLLSELGCPMAQGFLIARPMDADDYLRWLRERR